MACSISNANARCICSCSELDSPQSRNTKIFIFQTNILTIFNFDESKSCSSQLLPLRSEVNPKVLINFALNKNNLNLIMTSH